MDLLALAESDTTLKRVASTNGGEYAGACPFCGGTDRFRVWPERGRWWCRQCGRNGDTVAYLVERGDLTPQEAGRLRHGEAAMAEHNETATTKRGEPGKLVRQAVDPPPAVWQEQARVFVTYCQERLWSGGGKALDWLRWRGLTDETIRRFGLGWHDKNRWRDPGRWGLSGGKVRLCAGVIIPWTVGGAIWHVKVRRLSDDKPKYVAVTGGRPNLYGLDYLTGKRAVVICEAELDAVRLWQEAGDLVDVVALGSKGAKPSPSGLVYLAGASRWLVALDCDADEAADWWGETSARVRRVRPLQGNDVTEFAQAGGDLRAWVSYHLGRLTGSAVGEADALLDRMSRGDTETARAYATLAQAEGWPCYGTTWEQWAREVGR